MPWQDLLAFLADQDFTVLEGGEFTSQGLTHHQIVAAHVDLKLLVYADSYNWPDGEVVNTCRLYGVVRSRPGVAYADFSRMVVATGNFNHLGPAPAERMQLAESYITPLAARIAGLLEVAEFVNWGYMLPTFMTPNLLHHGIKNDMASVYEAFDAFLARCPAEVRAFITSADDGSQ